MPQHPSATEDFATVASVWSIGIVCWTATCDRILLESLWGNRCWAACGNVSGKPKADRQAGSNQFGTHDPLRSFLHSWTDPRNGQDGNYLFELEARFATYLKSGGWTGKGLSYDGELKAQ